MLSCGSLMLWGSYRLLRIAARLGIVAALLAGPVSAGQLAPDLPSAPEAAVEPTPPTPILCPAARLDQGGRLVEHCARSDAAADFAVRVYESPYDTGSTDWLAAREWFEALRTEEVVAAAGSGVATIGVQLEALLREFEAMESDVVGRLKATPYGRKLLYALGGLAGFVVIFGGMVAWEVQRRHRRKARRLNAARRTAAALMGELVAIRDELRDLTLDTQPGRLDALERVAAMRDAYVKNHPHLRLIERATATQIIGFYGQLRDLPAPYVEERNGKLGTHRVLRLEAADHFAHESESLASRAGQLAALLREWLDQNLPRREAAAAYQVRR